jgi:hypothetical protein
MTLRKAVPAKLALTDADDTRYDFRNLVTCNADGTPRGGVTSPVGTTLVTGTATMNVSVASFSAIATRDSGAILLGNDGPANVLIGAAPGSNQRTDIIYAKQNDSSSTVSSPDANNTPTLGVVAGTAGPSGGTPGSLPVGAVELARIVLTAGNANTNAGVITQTAPFTASPGAAVSFRTKADLDAWTTAQLGQHTMVIADSSAAMNGDYFNNGGFWTRLVTGRNLMRPTSVVNGVLSGIGLVTFTNLSAGYCQLNGVFTPAFPVYEVIVRVKSASAPMNLIARLAAAGVLKTSGYDSQSWYSSSGSLAMINTDVNNSQWQITITTATQHFTEIKIAGPAEAVQTLINSIDNAYNGTGSVPTIFQGGQRDTTAFDGFAIGPLSNSISGTIAVYGVAA